MTQIEITDMSSLHKYRTELPNIIYSLGLSLSEIGFYSYLKKVAGDQGTCFMSLPTLSENLGCSENTIRDIKKRLSERFELLEGKSLITIEKRICEKGNKTDIIKIIDIWPINFRSKIFNTGSKSEPGVVQNLNHPGSKFEPKEEPIKKNPINSFSTAEKGRDEKCGNVHNLPDSKILSNDEGIFYEFTKSQLYTMAVQQKKDWNKKEIEIAWNILFEYNDIINQPLAFICGTIKKLRTNEIINKFKESKCQEKKKLDLGTKHFKKQSSNFKRETTSKDLLVPLSVTMERSFPSLRKYFNS